MRDYAWELMQESFFDNTPPLGRQNELDWFMNRLNDDEHRRVIEARNECFREVLIWAKEHPDQFKEIRRYIRKRLEPLITARWAATIRHRLITGEYNDGPLNISYPRNPTQAR